MGNALRMGRVEGTKQPAEARRLFPASSQALLDPTAQYGPITFVGGEERWSVFGEVAGSLIYVAFATFGEGEEERVRIITARRATGPERREHERR